ncbi:type I-F CRISPR-associated protein Csy2 [Faucicola mancuniensis]|uniref:type I-F CRISPR-associated protein Csy2 n=1 Tax=Faucicola mancuniensis TaxID=1309795 RepID=UPI003977729C
MADYILLERIQVENANCIAGFTYGFPAITAFLGFEHALSRKLKEQIGIELSGCAIFCHDYEVNSYQDFYIRFIQSRNPPLTLKGEESKKLKSPASIIEEGKMDMTVSLLLRIDGILSSNSELKEEYLTTIKGLVYQSRLAGGSLKKLKSIQIVSDDKESQRKLKNILLPCFTLLDASHLLEEHFEKLQNEQSLLECWTDFFAFKEKAIRNHETDEISWQRYIPENKKGWIVPLMIGYKGISPLYSPEEVENLRDTRYPFRFVEAVHGLGEWKSLHRISDLNTLFWQYHVENEWYLCQQKQNMEIHSQSHQSEQTDLDDMFSQLGL